MPAVAADPAMVRRLIALYGDTTAYELSEGLAWYRKTYDLCRAMLPDDPKRAAGVIAILSPRARWATNVAWAAKVIEAAESGGACPSVSTSAMRKIAWRIATNSERPETAIKGPKTSMFYRAIIGDPDAVTIDVWARRAADGTWREWRQKSATTRDYSITDQDLKRCKASYAAAAKALGIPARDVQAAIWVHVRGAHG